MRCIAKLFALALVIALAHAEPAPPSPNPLLRPLAHELHIETYAVEPLVPALDGAIPLLDLGGHSLGPKLDEGQFCDLAAQSSAVIDDATYQVAGTAREPQAFCGRYFSRLNRKQPVAAGALSRSRFARIDWPYGLGAKGYKLVPYRSVAAAPSIATVGTALFVPSLRGRLLPNAERHDGYVLVADLREEARGDRIELFAGLRRALALDEAAQEIFIVDHPRIIEALRRLHRLD